LLVYEAHNVEGLLRTTLLDDGGFGTQLAEHVAALEYEICHAADLILCCSHQDRVLFHELYDVAFEKLLVAPNGTFTSRLRPATDAEQTAAKRELGFESGAIALFIGSNFPPNVEAAEFIVERLAPMIPGATFVICGDVGDALQAPGSNVRVTGRIDDVEKGRYLAAADFAINPMFSGSGTNIKMFDFMAAGIPTIATPTGARGITHAGEDAFLVRDPADFAAGLRRFLSDPLAARSLGVAGRRTVEQLYSWERISAAVGKLLCRRRSRLASHRPRFSVVIPTYERHDKLWEVVECLDLQTFRDFEVIVVDQSEMPWEGRNRYPELDLLYVHLDVKGAIHARNVGAFLALGDVLAFTDDDCLPLPDWLANAATRLEDSSLAGIEGLITSARRDDPEFRAVTNEGFAGGFMTANLFVRRAVFQAIDGFDYRFDHPHFREDTDLGWRATQHGAIPFCQEVRVYHPPHPRANEREAAAERARFFEKDALLLQKHPARYRRLFMDEAHYLHSEGFREHFLRGAAKYGVELDDFYLALLRPRAEALSNRADS
jgi:GT2 family glycosyltransferase